MAVIKKVAIVGPESSGKTFLAEKLAEHFQCLWVPEYAREYLEKINQPYSQADVEEIAKGQLRLEDTLAAQSNSILICDTNLLVIKIWLEHKYGTVPAWIENEIRQRHYDLHLLTKPDIPYEPDPLRENPEMGNYFFEKFKKELETIGAGYEIISGNENGRLAKAIKEINSIFLTSET